jgi:hypothetical protein
MPLAGQVENVWPVVKFLTADSAYRFDRPVCKCPRREREQLCCVALIEKQPAIDESVVNHFRQLKHLGDAHRLGQIFEFHFVSTEEEAL